MAVGACIKLWRLSSRCSAAKGKMLLSGKGMHYAERLEGAVYERKFSELPASLILKNVHPVMGEDSRLESLLSIYYVDGVTMDL